MDDRSVLLSSSWFQNTPVARSDHYNHTTGVHTAALNTDDGTAQRLCSDTCSPFLAAVITQVSRVLLPSFLFAFFCERVIMIQDYCGRLRDTVRVTRYICTRDGRAMRRCPACHACTGHADAYCGDAR